MYENSGATRKTLTDKRVKLIILVVCILALFFAYIHKLYSLQITQNADFQQRAKNNFQRMKVLPAQRGEIYDRSSSMPMVLNTESFAVDIIPGYISAQEFDTVTAKIAALLEVSHSSIQKKIPPNLRNSFQQIRVKSNVEYDTIVAITESITDLPGILITTVPMRNYVETGSVSHIIGYVGEITQDELQIRYNKGYVQSDIIGKSGVELYYDELLRGVNGYQMNFVDVKGRNIANSQTIIPPATGKKLILTIDTKVQQLAEKALGERIGSAIVLKPTTGDILAMVSYPYYNQNIFNANIGGEDYQKLLNDPQKPLLNRAVNANYPPASTFKVIMTAALLEEQAIDPSKTIECKGEITYGDRAFRCHVRKPGHGHLDLQHALAESCDIYYWTACRDNLGIDYIINYANEFGFGSLTGIDLPSESTGFVPTPEWKERRFHEKWLGGDTMNMSIGQGYLLASPLQVANMVAMVVNSGVIYKPHLLKEVRDSATDSLISIVQPEELHKSAISEDTFAAVRQYMAYTVSDGSAQFPLRNKTVKFAGKSGTAEVGLADRWHSWFAAYGPCDADPEDMIVVVVMVEASNPWEWWAPYATNIIMQGYFGNQEYAEAVNTLGFNYLMRPRGRAE